MKHVKTRFCKRGRWLALPTAAIIALAPAANGRLPSASALFSRGQPAEELKKPRLFVLTDIGGDPDDTMSMVRLMTYSNQIDIEGLVATHNSLGVFPEAIEKVVDAYGRVRANLEVNEPGFPDAAFLRSRIWRGSSEAGLLAIGAGKDSAGSDALIRAVDNADARPLWVTVWGGPTTLAQALWKVKNTRSKAELAQFVAKLRINAISDQDTTGPWIRKNFPDLFYIVSPGSTFHFSTWIGIGGDYFHGRFSGADWTLVSNEWLDRNIRSKGPLGAEYPRWKFMMEGDTPSFLNLIDNGLSEPEHPDWGGWGGRYELYTPRMRKWFFEPETRPIWTDAEDEVLGTDGRWYTSNYATVWRWRDAYQNDFAARMDWTIKPYADANHPPVVKLATPPFVKAAPGQRVDLSAAGTTDPDGDALSYRWFVYEEPGTRSMSSSDSGVKLEVKNFDQPQAWLTVKKDRVVAPGIGTIHVILAVTDHGVPRLTRYSRVIIDVTPPISRGK